MPSLRENRAIADKLKALPTKPGVYLFKDKNGTVIYIGKAKSLRKRVASYFKPNPDLKVSILQTKLRDIDFIVTGSEMDALILEDELVKKYLPRYNVALRDNKAYPFLKLTINEEWPRLLLARRKENDGALYFGRYQGGMVRAAIRLVKKLFPIRWCSATPLRKREQPCLYYHIGSCSGPCIGQVSHQDYQAIIEGIKLLLEGNTAKALEKLKTEMAKAAKALDYERAGYFRDSIQSLGKMIEGQTEIKSLPSLQRLGNTEELQKLLGIPKPIVRVECFDISNIQGSCIVGALVVFEGGVPFKNNYRKFKVRSVADKPNDVQAIFEVVHRRYSGSLAKSLSLPDLIMVDGGAAQVNFGKKALVGTKAEQVPIIGLAKKEEEIYLPGQRRTICLSKHSASLQLLQRVRDETHRFAVAYHRQKRGKALFS